jgi:hypothetical protein
MFKLVLENWKNIKPNGPTCQRLFSNHGIETVARPSDSGCRPWFSPPFAVALGSHRRLAVTQGSRRLSSLREAETSSPFSLPLCPHGRSCVHRRRLYSPLSTDGGHSPSPSKPEGSSPTFPSTSSSLFKHELAATSLAQASPSAAIPNHKVHRLQPPSVPLRPRQHTVDLRLGPVILYGLIFIAGNRVSALPAGVPRPPPCATINCPPR